MIKNNYKIKVFFADLKTAFNRVPLAELSNFPLTEILYL
jgi:hypothetical protein